MKLMQWFGLAVMVFVVYMIIFFLVDIYWAKGFAHGVYEGFYAYSEDKHSYVEQLQIHAAIELITVMLCMSALTSGLVSAMFWRYKSKIKSGAA